MNAAQVIESFRKEFPGIEISLAEQGAGRHKKVQVWATVAVKDFKNAVKHLFTIQEYPHFSVSSGSDIGKEIEIINHFVLNYGEPGEQVPFHLKVKLPKGNPVMDSITGLFPGAVISEQEKMEMLGIKIEGVPKKRVFTDESMPAGIYPWRKDDKGPEKIARNLHEGEGK
ncbi:MAG: NADH-quinone oxidoreductase subunit C [Candidatus Diapherotrites archaeon]|nr:NADH-quinone oxidoreductase subunit C [Candidatus Diapherotrites archaeon]